MKYIEIKNNGKQQLQRQLDELREKLSQLQMKDRQGQLNSVRDIRKAKKDIARIMTAINSKKTEESKTNK